MGRLRRVLKTGRVRGAAGRREQKRYWNTKNRCTACPVKARQHFWYDMRNALVRGVEKQSHTQTPYFENPRSAYVTWRCDGLFFLQKKKKITIFIAFPIDI